ncbi:MAG: DNA-3-methyladenine glycosylase 2 family protein [Burkholderiales bacterium]|jgi:DNA-3-methyladenine glycosylase II|nr:DNA-3-methyladenine glycosylase 2 family protein [Burkholderiales bacterium]
MKPVYWDKAIRILARRDPVMRRLVRAYPEFHLRRRSDAFTTLARAIVGQQISVKAAEAVWRKFVIAVEPENAGKVFPKLLPAAVAATDDETLRMVGLSRQKAEYVRDLARHFAEGRLKPRSWKKLDDETLITALSSVKGIGRWSAEMFLIFHELRADVFPVADLGLQRALRLFYPEQCDDVTSMRNIAENWRPYRSVATWYLWRSLDPLPVEY